MKYGRILSINMPVAIVIACLLALLPGNAWAIQSHGPPEGLYVHQMAHVHCFLALGYLLWDIRRSSFAGQGWRYLQLFCILMLFWNVVSFVGHSLAIHIDPDMISATSYFFGRIHGPVTVHKLIFYMTKFDHFIAVPALFFLYIGMRTLYNSIENEDMEGDE